MKPPPREPLLRLPMRARNEVLNRLGHLLVERGVLSPDRVEELEHRAHWLDEPLDRVLEREGVVPEETLRDLLSEISGLPVVSLVREQIAPDVIARLPAAAVLKYRVMPFRVEEGGIALVSDRVFDPDEEGALRVLLGTGLSWALCTRHELDACIKHYYGVGLSSFLGGRRAAASAQEESPDITGFVNEILREAIDQDATDLHFEPYENRLRVRSRIDGVLYPVPLPRGIDPFAKAVIASIKVMAQLNIAERRLPQDGRFAAGTPEAPYDLRVSVLPTPHGEAVNLRILNRQAVFLQLDELGLSETHRRDLDELIALPHGMLLFTGPTGSGKTTSLYAALAHLNNTERKIITLEDPVEYQIPGITQMQVQPDIGFTFPAGLRSILRHDPDVILVGEIRDAETAHIAISAAMTGHLVFSTLHTNDSASAAARLIDMGIEPYLVASSVEGVVAQRLLRRICTACREAVEEDGLLREEARRLFPSLPEDQRFYRGVGCPECRFLGYRGRRAIFEIFVMNDELRKLAVARAPSAVLLRRAVELGLVTLRESGWDCALAGQTTVGEVLRLTQRVGGRSHRHASPQGELKLGDH